MAEVKVAGPLKRSVRRRWAHAVLTSWHLRLIGIIFGALACGTSVTRHEPGGISTLVTIRRNQLAIAGVSIGSPEKDVLRAFGRPMEAHEEPDGITDQPSRLLSYQGVEVYLVLGKVYNLRCSTPLYSTHNGVRVGDPVEKVELIYGPGERYAADGGDLIRFTVSGTDTYLIFHVRDSRVSEIELWFDYT
jgi:hypothetical protein